MMEFTSTEIAAFLQLAKHKLATRPQIGAALGVSRPTMSATMASLEEKKLIEIVGTERGNSGRSAIQYRIAQALGMILAVDAGTSVSRIRAMTLDGTVQLETSINTISYEKNVGGNMSRTVDMLVSGAIRDLSLTPEKVLAIGIALPSRGPVAEEKQAEHIPASFHNIFQHFTPPEGVTVVLENNVNCAAIGEHQLGAAVGIEDFTYIQAGNKIGMGIILNNKLIRGSGAAAGEIGHLPFPWGPNATPVVEELEVFTGLSAFLRRVQANWHHNDGRLPVTFQDVLAAYRAGTPSAVGAMEDYGRHIGHIAATAVAIVNPQMIVIGGPLIVEEIVPIVAATVRNISFPTTVKLGTLSERATLHGVAHLTSSRVVDTILNRG